MMLCLFFDDLASFWRTAYIEGATCFSL